MTSRNTSKTNSVYLSYLLPENRLMSESLRILYPAGIFLFLAAETKFSAGAKQSEKRMGESFEKGRKTEIVLKIFT